MMNVESGFRFPRLRAATLLLLSWIVLPSAAHGDWPLQDVAEGVNCAMVEDPAGRPAFAVVGPSIDLLFWVTTDGTTWTSEFAAPGAWQGEACRRISLDFDPAGEPGIAFATTDNGPVRLTRRTEGVWGSALVLESSMSSGHYSNDTDTPLTGTPILIILDVAGSYWCGPSWRPLDQGIDHYTHGIPPGASELPVLPLFAWPADAGQAEGILFWGALTTLELDQLLAPPSSWELGWS